MKRFFLLSIIFVIVVLGLLPSGSSNAMMRRGNPTTANPRYEFYIVDSDDDSPLSPSYNFVDTSYGSWMRMVWKENFQ